MSSHAYTPTETRVAEETLSWWLRRLGCFSGELALASLFYRRDRRQVDGDNLLKLVLDAGMIARTWEDDSQVKGGAFLVKYDKSYPRTVVALANR